MTIQQHVGEMMCSLKQASLKLRNLIIWFNSSIPVKTRFCIGYQPILYYVKSDKSVFNYGIEQRVSKAVLPYGRINAANSLKDIWDDIPFVSAGCMASSEAVLIPGTKRKAHPCQMPIRLAQRMIAYTTRPDQLVLDPFVGSGTTLLAARSLGRRAIGIEKNPEYCKLIINRLEKEQYPAYIPNTSKKLTKINDIFE